MKKTLFLFLTLGLATLNTHSQSFDLNGLEIYNRTYFNPAFTGTNRLLQVDIMNYDYQISKGFNTRLITSIPNSQSAVGVCFRRSNIYTGSFSSFGDNDLVLSLRSTGFELMYAYKHNFSEEMDLSGGLRLTQGNMHCFDSACTYQSSNSGSIQLGLVFRYKKFYAGLSAGTGLFLRRKQVDENDTPIISWSSPKPITTNFIAGYSLGGERRVHFDPVVGYYSYLDLKTEYKESGYFAGGNIIIVKTIGMGFTVGTLNSLSASVTIMDRVSLMFGIISTEKIENSFSDYQMNYGLDFDPLEYIVQLRVKL